MSRGLSYKGYIVFPEFDEEDGIMFGLLAGIKARVSFHGETVDEFVKAFHEMVDFYLQTCADREETPEKPDLMKYPPKSLFDELDVGTEVLPA